MKCNLFVFVNMILLVDAQAPEIVSVLCSKLVGDRNFLPISSGL